MYINQFFILSCYYLNYILSSTFSPWDMILTFFYLSHPLVKGYNLNIIIQSVDCWHLTEQEIILTNSNTFSLSPIFIHFHHDNVNHHVTEFECHVVCFFFVIKFFSLSYHLTQIVDEPESKGVSLVVMKHITTNTHGWLISGKFHDEIFSLYWILGMVHIINENYYYSFLSIWLEYSGTNFQPSILIHGNSQEIIMSLGIFSDFRYNSEFTSYFLFSFLHKYRLKK